MGEPDDAVVAVVIERNRRSPASVSYPAAFTGLGPEVLDGPPSAVEPAGLGPSVTKLGGGAAEVRLPPPIRRHPCPRKLLARPSRWGTCVPRARSEGAMLLVLKPPHASQRQGGHRPRCRGGHRDFHSPRAGRGRYATTRSRMGTARGAFPNEPVRLRRRRCPAASRAAVKISNCNSIAF